MLTLIINSCLNYSCYCKIELVTIHIAAVDFNISPVVRKPVIEVTDQVRYKETKRSSNVRETDIYRTQGTRICCLTYSLFSLLKTPVYTPTKRSFRVVYCFQPVRHSIIPWFCQWVIPSTFKVFFCNLSNVCPILFNFSPHDNHQTMHIW